MNVDTLVAMANQIGEFFDAMPDRAEALDGLTEHIRRFWAPRMRKTLTDHFEATGGAGLSPIVVDALNAHSILPTPVPVREDDPNPVARAHIWEGDTES